MLNAEYIYPSTESGEGASQKRPVLSIASYLTDEMVSSPRKRRRVNWVVQSPESEPEMVSPSIPQRRRSSIFLIRQGPIIKRKSSAEDHSTPVFCQDDDERKTTSDSLVDEEKVSESLEQLTDSMGDWSLTNVRRLRRNNIYSSVNMPKREVRRARSDVMRMLRRESSGSIPSSPRKTSMTKS